MERYTVLLVDDEEEVIRVILRKIDWEALGFSVIGYANNGVKALEILEEAQPDVVVTDIRMPYMDGMELAQRIRKEYPATKVLFFTGFDEFEYAKEAVHLEAEEYILKPANSAELTEVFARLKEKLDQEISEKQNVEVLQNYYLESLPFLQANFYSTLIEGRIQEEKLPKYLSDYQISLEGPFFCCLVIHTSSRGLQETINPLLLFASVQRQAQERLAEKWRARFFSYLGNTVMLAQLDRESEVAALTDECDRFCRYVHRIHGAVVTVGIGQVCRNILDLAASYGNAREAVSYRILYGASRAINIKEIAPRETRTAALEYESELSRLFKMIRVGGAADMERAVDAYLDRSIALATSLQQHRVAVMELVGALFRFSSNNDIPAGRYFGDVKELYNGLLELETDELRRWLLELSISFHNELTSARSRSSQSFVEKAKAYVRSHYADESLSLDTVCGELGLSNSYFSTIFKKETGTSFVGYLTDYRMEQASRLLVETNDKNYIIAKSVGYADPNYFSYVFKRRYGMSPLKYRTEHEKSEA